MNRKVNLIEHLPLFIQVYREIKQIMTAENPEFQMLHDESEKIKNNQFIQTCDLNGIAKFEKLLKINPSIDDTLESRISRVLVRWNDIVPYTWKVLLNKLDTLCGIGNYNVIPNFTEYTLEIITRIDTNGQLEELENTLDYIMPANIVVKINNKFNYVMRNELFVPIGMCSCDMYAIGKCEVEITDSII